MTIGKLLNQKGVNKRLAFEQLYWGDPKRNSFDDFYNAVLVRMKSNKLPIY